MVIVIGMIPAAAAARTDISYDVASGKEVELVRSDFRTLYNDNSSSISSNFSYLVFTDYRDLKYYGQFSALDKNGRTVSLDENNLQDVWFYYNNDDISYNSDCRLSGLTFVADRTASSGTMALSFKLQGTRTSDYVEGTLKITVDGSKSANTISYEVKPGSTVSFSRSDFNKLFQQSYTGNVFRVVFDRPDSDSFDEGTLSCGSTQFTYRSLDDATFYYDST